MANVKKSQVKQSQEKASRKGPKPPAPSVPPGSSDPSVPSVPPPPSNPPAQPAPPPRSSPSASPRSPTPALSLTFYDGCDTIGGNKIVLMPQHGHGLLLDFGYNFGTGKIFLDEFVNLRSNDVLKDGITLGFLPVPTGDLAGLYLPLLAKTNKAEINALFDVDLDAPPRISHMLPSHFHTDHIGWVNTLNPAIYLALPQKLRPLLEYFDNTEDFGSKFKCLTYRDNKTVGARGGRSYGDPLPRPICDLIDEDSNPLDGNEQFKITPWLIDHSVPGAYAYLITHTPTEFRIIYTGDWRFHGALQDQMRRFTEASVAFHPDLVLFEGVNLGQPEGRSEAEVEAEITTRFNAITGENNLIFFECAARDAYRLQSIYRAARSVNRQLVIRAGSYSFLLACRDATIPNLDLDLDQIRVYLPRKGWGVYEQQDYSGTDEGYLLTSDPTCKPKYAGIDLTRPYLIKAADLHAHPERYVVITDFYHIIELVDIQPPPNAFYLISKSEFDEDEEGVHIQRRDNWLRRFGIPETHVFQIHSSGHCYASEIRTYLNRVRPRVVMPMHTVSPHEAQHLGLDAAIRIYLPQKGVKIDLDTLTKPVFF